MPVRRTVVVVALSLALAACGKGDGKAAQKDPSPGSGSASAQATPAGVVKIYVDDAQVGAIAIDQIKLWPRLDTLVPVAARRFGTWQAINMTADGKPVVVAQPSSTHPDRVPALFPGDRGPAFGMFDPVELARKGTPAVRHDGLSEVRVVLAKGSGRGENDHQGDGGGGDPAQLKLEIKTPKGTQTIEGTKLLAMPNDPPPGESEGKGWKLTTILTQAGVTAYERLLLTDVKGVNLTLEKQDLDPATAIPFVKLNRQGQLRFRVFRKQGDTWQPGSDLRGLASIEILK